MKKYEGISIRSCSSFREEARAALRGKWKSALLVFLVLMLMTGAIIGANCSYTYSDETLVSHWELKASIGPFTTLSYWRNGNLYLDSATGNSSPFVLPYNPLFVAAAALTALFFLVLMPISNLAQTRLSLNLLDGISPDFSVLRTSARKYWLYVRTGLLVFWSIFWPMMLCLLAGMLLSGAIPDLELLSIPIVIAGFVLLIIRAFSYAATVYLVVTRPDMTARRALKASREMMKGRKWRYFCLGLSFFGWDLLAAAFATTLIMIFGQTSMFYLSSLFSVLAFIPLYLYMLTAQIAFLRDADSRTNNQTPVSDMVGAMISGSADSAEAPDAPETAAQSTENPEDDKSLSTPDDPWSDTEK